MDDDPHDLRRPAGDRDGRREHRARRWRACCSPTTARGSSRSSRRKAIGSAADTPPGSSSGTGARRASSPTCGPTKAAPQVGDLANRGRRASSRASAPGWPTAGASARRRSRAANPGLVYCSVKGFGSSGAYATLPAYEGIVAAKAGCLQPRAVRLPLRPDLRQRAVGQRRHGPHGVRAASSPRSSCGSRRGAASAVEATHGPGPQPARLLRHDDVAAHAANHGIGRRFVGDAAVMGASRYSFFVPHARRPVGDLHADAAPPGARAQPGGRHRAHLRRSPLRQAAARSPPPKTPRPGRTSSGKRCREQTYEHWEKVFLADDDIAFELARFERGRSRPPADPSQRRVDHGARRRARRRRAGRSGRRTSRDAVTDRSVGSRARRTPRAASPSCPPVTRDGAGAGSTRSPASRSSSSATSTPCPTASPWPARSAPGSSSSRARTATPCGPRSARPRSAAPRRWRARRASPSTSSTRRVGRSCTRSSATADVFVNGFRPGVAERLGLDYATLSKLNPRLVYVHAAGYGVDGPSPTARSTPRSAQAVAGSIGRHGGRWLDPEFTNEPELHRSPGRRVAPPPRPVDGDSNAALGGALVDPARRCTTSAAPGEGQFLSHHHDRRQRAGVRRRLRPLRRQADPPGGRRGEPRPARAVPALPGGRRLDLPRRAPVNASGRRLIAALDRNDLARRRPLPTAEARGAPTTTRSPTLLAAIFATRPRRRVGAPADSGRRRLRGGVRCQPLGVHLHRPGPPRDGPRRRGRPSGVRHDRPRRTARRDARRRPAGRLPAACSASTPT